MKNFRRIKRKLLANHVNAVRAAVLLMIGIFIYFTSSTLQGALRGSFVYTAATSVGNFLFTPDEAIAQFDSRTNILLLGAAGEGNSAPELTDTIIVASIKHDDPRDITLISVPRDIWNEDLNDKINAAYMLGEEKTTGGGLVLARSILSEIVGLPIHYAVKIDFSAFEEAIDIIGGVEVVVDKSFTDEKYPILGKEDDDCGGDPDYKCRYETISFSKGRQLMDSETALKFSRSRQSTDPEEGNDLARAKRQQKVLSAIKDKILSKEVIFSPKKLYALWELGRRSTVTDLNEKQIAILARRVLQSQGNTKSFVLPEELLFNPPLEEKYNYLYVFVPANDERDWSDVHGWVWDILR